MTRFYNRLAKKNQLIHDYLTFSQDLLKQLSNVDQRVDALELNDPTDYQQISKYCLQCFQKSHGICNTRKVARLKFDRYRSHQMVKEKVANYILHGQFENDEKKTKNIKLRKSRKRRKRKYKLKNGVLIKKRVKTSKDSNNEKIEIKIVRRVKKDTIRAKRRAYKEAYRKKAAN